MAQCSECGAETLLYVFGIPLCDKCDDKRSEKDRINAPAEPNGKDTGNPATGCQRLEGRKNCAASVMPD
jgi:hypothetical protein